jgi:hypothetical protein
MHRLGGAARRKVAIACAGAVALGAAGMIAAGAATTVRNPGNIHVNMNASLHTVAADVAGITLFEPAPATVTAGGALTIPQAGLRFNDVDVRVHVTDPPVGDVKVTIGFAATSAFTGNINLSSGSVSLNGSVKVLFSALGVLKDCPIGPVAVALKTSPGGVAYSAANGRATVFGRGFTVPSVPAHTAGCANFEDLINKNLGLPSTAQTLRVALEFSPVLRAPTTTARPVSTTVGVTPASPGGGEETSTTEATTPTSDATTPTTEATTSTSEATTTTKATTTTAPAGTHVVPTTGTTPVTSPPGGSTSTTWPQHCTGGDPNRCHDTHHPHVPHTPSG